MKYLRSKLLNLIPVFFIVTFGSFMMLELLPGNPVDALLFDEDAAAPDPAVREAMMKELGLDKPVIVRYFKWMGNLVQGDLGRSYETQQVVTEALAQRIPVSFQLVIMAQTVAILLAIPLGMLCAYRHGRPVDRWISATAFGILAVPVFVVAVSMIFLFAVTLQWLPASGFVPMSKSFWGNLESMLLPSIAIAIAEVPILLRVLRSDMISVLQEDYISMAKAKGISTATILFNHALRPSSFTLVTIIGLQIGSLITGSVILETIYGLPGVGKLLIEAIDARDEIMVQGIVTFIALVYVLVNFTVDMTYALIDPRVARERGLR